MRRRRSTGWPPRAPTAWWSAAFRRCPARRAQLAGAPARRRRAARRLRGGRRRRPPRPCEARGPRTRHTRAVHLFAWLGPRPSPVRRVRRRGARWLGRRPSRRRLEHPGRGARRAHRSGARGPRRPAPAPCPSTRCPPTRVAVPTGIEESTGRSAAAHPRVGHLLGGEPGIGSPPLLQAAGEAAAAGDRVLYVRGGVPPTGGCGPAGLLGPLTPCCGWWPTRARVVVLGHLAETRPALVIVDSVQAPDPQLCRRPARPPRCATSPGRGRASAARGPPSCSSVTSPRTARWPAPKAGARGRHRLSFEATATTPCACSGGEAPVRPHPRAGPFQMTGEGLQGVPDPSSYCSCPTGAGASRVGSCPRSTATGRCWWRSRPSSPVRPGNPRRSAQGGDGAAQHGAGCARGAGRAVRRPVRRHAPPPRRSRVTRPGADLALALAGGLRLDRRPSTRAWWSAPSSASAASCARWPSTGAWPRPPASASGPPSWPRQPGGATGPAHHREPPPSPTRSGSAPAAASVGCFRAGRLSTARRAALPEPQIPRALHSFRGAAERSLPCRRAASAPGRPLREGLTASCCPGWAPDRGGRRPRRAQPLLGRLPARRRVHPQRLFELARWTAPSSWRPTPAASPGPTCTWSPTPTCPPRRPAPATARPSGWRA